MSYVSHHDEADVCRRIPNEDLGRDPKSVMFLFPKKCY
jgi:hypothetical protein